MLGVESATATSTYVSAISTTANGRIEITIGAGIDSTATGKKVLLEPRTTAGAALAATAIPAAVGQWACGAVAADLAVISKFLPSTCRVSF